MFVKNLIILSKHAIQHDAHFKANLTGPTCYYIPNVFCFSSLVKYSITILILTIIAIINDPNANDPNCLNDLNIDLQIGELGYPS